jgi:hypothetical protein
MTETIGISSSCECVDLDGNPEDNCWGCYDDAEENLHHLIINWLGENDVPSDASILVSGTNMNWDRVSGYANCNANTILDVLKLERSDYRLEFYQDGKELTAKRWSHDEPMGASFTFTITKEK